MSALHDGRGRVRAAGIALLAAAVLPGCGARHEYPPNLSFPSRTDRLVLKLPDKPADALGDPFKREEEIARLDALGGRTLDPASTPGEARKAIDASLRDAFGPPAAPVRGGEPDPVLAEGARLYRAKCQQCHNLSGDGRGTAGATIPFPRDYRQGQFKFVSTGDGSGKPRLADLERTLADGLRGTPMPPFALLPEGDRKLLATYVVHLSTRGQVEFECLKAAAEGRPADVSAVKAAVLAEWQKAESAPPLPPERDDGSHESPAHQEAVRRGYNLFVAKADHSCVSCHGEFGRKPVLRYDVWGTVAQPANLTQNDAMKAGSRPKDVFARIRGGIPAVGMPAHPPAKYSDNDVWDLVRFVRSLPYQVQLPPDVREAVYPGSR
ncbi:MAG: c-type cytochrome [Gemmataceae bacterium]|nr:c-type cytochrome [Gemmataceae bacterium]